MVHVPSYRRRPGAVASIQLPQAEAALPTRRRVPPGSRMGHRAPLDAVEVPETFVDEAIHTPCASDGHPVRRCGPARQRPGPTASMPFERMVQPEPATTGLVGEKSCLPVDPLPLVLQHNDQLSAAIIMRFLDFQPIVRAKCERVELLASAFSSPERKSDAEYPTAGCSL
jgi:hypothetical protein